METIDRQGKGVQALPISKDKNAYITAGAGAGKSRSLIRTIATNRVHDSSNAQARRYIHLTDIDIETIFNLMDEALMIEAHGQAVPETSIIRHKDLVEYHVYNNLTLQELQATIEALNKEKCEKDTVIIIDQPIHQIAESAEEIVTLFNKDKDSKYSTQVKLWIGVQAKVNEEKGIKVETF